jgi:hypothetical protein
LANQKLDNPIRDVVPSLFPLSIDIKGWLRKARQVIDSRFDMQRSGRRKRLIYSLCTAAFVRKFPFLELRPQPTH